NLAPRGDVLDVEGERPVLLGGRQQFLVAGNKVDGVRFPTLPFADLCARNKVPQYGKAVTAPGGQNVSTGRQDERPVFTSPDPAQLPCGGNVPDPDRLVVTGRDQHRAVRGESELS